MKFDSGKAWLVGWGVIMAVFAAHALWRIHINNEEAKVAQEALKTIQAADPLTSNREDEPLVNISSDGGVIHFPWMGKEWQGRMVSEEGKPFPWLAECAKTPDEVTHLLDAMPLHDAAEAKVVSVPHLPCPLIVWHRSGRAARTKADQIKACPNWSSLQGPCKG